MGKVTLLCDPHVIVHACENKTKQFFAEICNGLMDIFSTEIPGAAADGTQDRNQPRSNIAHRADDQPDFVVHELYAADFYVR